jgi:spore germination protein YaaH
MQLGRRLVILSLVLGSALPALAGAWVEAGEDPQPRTARALTLERPLRMAYYYPADQAAERSLRSNLARLDIIAPHWLTVDETGTVRAKVPAAAVPTLRSSRALILPSVMVTDRAAGHAILTDPAISATTIENLLAAVSTWDGLALDFEGLDAADRPGLTRFIHQLGAALAAAGKTYAIAVPAKTQDTRTGWSGAYDYRAIAGAADLYLVMAYGYAVGSSPPGSTAPINWVTSAMAYALSEIPPERLILGIPFYGYDWNISQGPPARALRYDEVQALLEATGAAPQLDARTRSRTFSYESNGDLHEVWYEDAESLAAKLELVGRFRLAGVGAWRLGQEDPAIWPLWDAMLGRSPTNVSTPVGSDGRVVRGVASRRIIPYPW